MTAADENDYDNYLNIRIVYWMQSAGYNTVGKNSFYLFFYKKVM